MNARPALFATSTNGILLNTGYNLSGVTSLFTNFVGKRTGNSSPGVSSFILGTAPIGGGTPNNSSKFHMRTSTVDSSFSIAGTTIASTTGAVVTKNTNTLTKNFANAGIAGLRISAANTGQVFLDGAPSSEVSSFITSPFDTTNITLLNYASGSNRGWVGYATEAILFSTDISEIDRNSLTIDQGAYYSVVVVPQAPTLVVATSTDAQATVSFTAPTSNGGSAITGYTVTSSPGGITATGTSSPITVTGLQNGTSYTFTVTATNSVGTSTASTASNSVTPTYLVDTIVIKTPAAYQVVQRDPVSNKGQITISGLYFGNPTAIEASWNGLPFQTIVASPSGGTFTGVLTDLPPGQGTVTVRYADAITTSSSVTTVGVGDIFVLAGQSNFSGRGFSNQTYLAPTSGVVATMYGNDYTWKTLIDPVDTNTGQIDAISADASSGSVFPLLAALIAANQNVPIAFVPTAKGGSTASQWLPAANHFSTSTLYGSMANRISSVGGKTRAVLWYQGETDAQNCVTYSNYTSQMNTIIDSIASDFPNTKTLVGQIGHTTYTDSCVDDIRRAQQDLPKNNTNALQGAITYDINLSDEAGDTLHFRSNGDLKLFADRWWNAINRSVYSGSIQEILSPVNVVYNTVLNTIDVVFNNPLASVTASSFTNNLLGALGLPSTSAFSITATGSTPIITSISLPSAKTIRLHLSGAAATALNLTYASGNSAVNNALYATDGMPVSSFYAIPATLVTQILVPNTPTAVSASEGNAQATVSFTAPTNNDGSDATSYTVTSSPGSITATGTSSPITITGLTNGTAYTFTVTATNGAGTSASSTASNSVTPDAFTATTFTFTGPTSGNANTTSTNFTITPNNPYTGTITITPSGAAAAGLSPQVLNFSNSAVAQILTFTPTVAGTLTLTATNSGGLFNPTALTYIVQGFINYDFELDTLGNNPTDTSAENGSFNVVSIDASTKVLQSVASSTTFLPATLLMKNFPPSSNYSIVWRGAGVSNAYRNGFLLRGQPTPYSNFTPGSNTRSGYFFQASNSNSSARIYKFDQTLIGGSVVLASAVLAPRTVASSSRWWRATASGNQLTLDYSDSSGTGPWINIVSTVDYSFTSGYTSYLDGFGTLFGNAYVDDITMAYTSVTPIKPDVPSTPTATAGNGGAVVSFTEPSNNGGSAITGYTVTSSPGGITASGVSSPIALVGLTGGTAYTFTVTASNSAGTSAASAASNAATLQVSELISSGASYHNSEVSNFYLPPTSTSTTTNTTPTTGTTTTTTTTTPSSIVNPFTTAFLFTKNLKLGSIHPEVQKLQQFLNANKYTVATTGAGSIGKETNYFGPATVKAINRFQLAYTDTILTPLQLTKPTGNFFAATRKVVNSMLQK
jgi:hypothetical protein